LSQDATGIWTVDAKKTVKRRGEIRKERLARSLPTREWMKEERERVLTKHASRPVRHMFATSFGLSEKFLNDFRKFWDLPADWNMTEAELDVPSYGSKYRMDLSLLPDVTTVVQVEE
jgi:acetone carboxylase alpha subunit